MLILEFEEVFVRTNMPCEEFKDNASHRSLWENKKELHVLYKTL